MKSKKDQYIVHAKRTQQWGVEKAMTPTAPSGRGWRLISVTFAGDYFMFFWHRQSRQPLPINQFKYR